MAAVNRLPRGDASVQRCAGCLCQTSISLSTACTCQLTHKAADAIAAYKRRGSDRGHMVPLKYPKAGSIVEIRGEEINYANAARSFEAIFFGSRKKSARGKLLRANPVSPKP